MHVLRGFWRAHGQERVLRGSFLWVQHFEGWGTCRGHWACGRVPSHVESRAYSQTQLGTLPFSELQPHEIFRLLDAAHPLLSPSASTLPLHHLWLPPPPPRCGEGKIRSQTRGGSVPTLWARGTGSKLDLPHNTPHTGKESESRN